MLLFLLPLVFMGYARSSDGADEDPMEVWNDLADELRRQPGVTNVELFPTKSSNLFVGIELSHAAIVAGPVDTLDTGITPTMCEESPLRIEIRIQIPDLDVRQWWGFYEAGTKAFVDTQYGVTFGGHPDLRPELSDETGTFVVRLPCEG
ncbi:MAG: hypothetical protein JSW52_07155 [Candidatus Coatesbacteria bacterium]|nr:MAG: hypothetical protein JSW52_07155 [Candidatus Coatesbacteria bacterium]